MGSNRQPRLGQENHVEARPDITDLGCVGRGTVRSLDTYLDLIKRGGLSSIVTARRYTDVIKVRVVKTRGAGNFFLASVGRDALHGHGATGKKYPLANSLFQSVDESVSENRRR